MRNPLLSTLLFLFVAITNISAQPTVTISPDVHSAASQATAELNYKTSEIDKAVQKTAPDAHSKSKVIQAPSRTEVPVRVTIVQTDDKKQLIDEVKSFVAYAEGKELMYSRLSTALIFLTAALALAGGIASFMSRNKTAGVISLIVAAVVGLSNAYPVSSLSSFYSDMKSQGRLILADCMFVKPYTETLYSADVAQYKLLIVAERHKPTVGNYDNPAPAANAEMKSVSIKAKNADTAKAAAHDIVGFSDKQDEVTESELHE